MRIPLIAGNWKMNTTVAEAIELVGEMLPALDAITGVDKLICPPFVSLAPVKTVLTGTSIKLGAQNMYFQSKGAFTGEISPIMLVNLVDFVILGHSERRQYFQETDDIINKKINTALEIGLSPIFCVGEKLEDNEKGKTEEIIKKQVGTGLSGIKPNEKLVVAYEPIWAIGTGKAATGKQANVTINIIRENISNIWDKEISQRIRILYGGSVTSSNIDEFIIQPDIDGALVGGASLKAEEFIGIVSQSAKLKAAR